MLNALCDRFWLESGARLAVSLLSEAAGLPGRCLRSKVVYLAIIE